ncbi:MAG TPA: 1-acyl-sn-glycerol-3-phosphate acyltransferase [Acidimicrobiia bacterium]|nr:1-acyl-sn-glycerol-3-phosphate acyltransferase [Acidimicrobiia bacterium]
MRWLSYRVMRWLGWEIAGELPDVPKMVIVGAPHTSNWDFFLFLGTIHHFDIKVNFLGKASLFRWPFGAMFRKVGGIPVHRSRSGGMVGQVKAAFDAAQRMILVVAPEGTRKAAPHWKSGFVEIAAGAAVPVVIAGVDGANRVLTVSPPFDASGDRTYFMDQVRQFLSDKDGLRAEGKGPVRLEDEPVSS